MSLYLGMSACILFIMEICTQVSKKKSYTFLRLFGGPIFLRVEHTHFHGNIKSNRYKKSASHSRFFFMFASIRWRKNTRHIGGRETTHSTTELLRTVFVLHARERKGRKWHLPPSRTHRQKHALENNEQKENKIS